MLLIGRYNIFLVLSVHLVTGTIKDKGWWRHAVFYQVYPRSFMDSNDDGVGDLKGITQRLGHFIDAGVDAIWLSPIYSTPMRDFGYDISNYRDVHREYGTLEDLKELTTEAGKLGLKIVMDFVPNHTSNEHPWFQQSLKGNDKYKDYYVWRAGRSNNTEPPNNWISQFNGSAWNYEESRDMWYYHGFGWFQPELNYTNPDVRKEMIDILRFWLDKGIDGFRVDAIPYIYEADDFPDEPITDLSADALKNWRYAEHIYTEDDPRTYDLVASWRKVLDDWADTHNDVEKVILTEAYTSLVNATKYYKYGAQVPMNFDMIMKVNKNSKPSDFKKIIDDWMKNMPSGEVPNWVLGNHDRSRLASRFPGRGDQLLMLSMILPGIAVTYCGEEIGMTDNDDITWEETVDPQACNSGDPDSFKLLTRDPERSPYQWDDSENAGTILEKSRVGGIIEEQFEGFSNASKTWLPVNKNYKELNLAKQKRESTSRYKLYKALITMRRASKALKSGHLELDVFEDDSILSVARRLSDEVVILLLNFSNERAQRVNSETDKDVQAMVFVPADGLAIDWSPVTVISNILLPPNGSAILRIKAQKAGKITR